VSLASAISFKIFSAVAAAGATGCLLASHQLGSGLALAGLFTGAAVSLVALDRRKQVEIGTPDEQLFHSPTGRPNRRRVLIVGAGAVGRQLAAGLEADPKREVIGFVDDHFESDQYLSPPVLGRRDAAAAIVKEYGVDEVYLAHAPTWQQCLTEELTADCPEVVVTVVPSPYEAMMRTGSIQHCGDIALVRLHQAGGKSKEIVKRGFDVAAAAAILLVSAPFMLITALLIKLTSAGPIIFAQERTGRHGRPFLLFKFRTMVQDAETRTGPVLSSGKADSRLTPVGRWLRLFRIDELPQLWNVLRGEMSLVGPRPERPYFVDKFECLVPSYARRHQVRPGITGLAQVCGGYHTDARDKLRFDLIYITHQSLLMDLYVLLRTVLVVVLPNGR
jgi:exopolysaccharide biosynthesis polyprenyl glycosylphosphotransferase